MSFVRKLFRVLPRPAIKVIVRLLQLSLFLLYLSVVIPRKLRGESTPWLDEELARIREKWF